MIGIMLASLFTLVHSTDGGVDDFATTALIAAAQENDKQEMKESFDFSSIIITNADCEPVSALSGYCKTVEFLKIPARVALSSSRVWHPFPWMWRMDSEAVNQLPCLKNQVVDHIAPYNGNQILADTLNNAKEVKIIATGPLTTIADVLKEHPELINKISEIHWMGGAIDVIGNILESPEIPAELLNDKAEWNVFCDAEGADWIFRNTSFAIYLYPLDISDITIPRDFINVLNKHRETTYSKYMKECYKIVDKVELYRMWDVVAAAGVLFPEVLNPPVKEKLRVGLYGKEEGTLFRDESGRDVFVYKEFKNNDPNIFYEEVAKVLTR